MEFYLGTNWKHVTDPNSNAGTSPQWDCEITGKIAVSQIQRDNVRVRIMDKNDITKDKILGESTFSCAPLLAKLDQWVTIGGDMLYENKPAGKFAAICKFRPETIDSVSSFDMEAQMKKNSGLDPKLFDKLAKDLKDQQDELAKKIGSIEEGVRKQLHDVRKS